MIPYASGDHMTFLTSRRSALKLGLGALTATAVAGSLTACAAEAGSFPASFASDTNYSTKAARPLRRLALHASSS